ncbi:hypothetical protein GCM10009813_08610 [Brevibacterium marinum]
MTLPSVMELLLTHEFSAPDALSRTEAAHAKRRAPVDSSVRFEFYGSSRDFGGVRVGWGSADERVQALTAALLCHLRK